mmetsp:Transcript_43876/g.81952  ORF Transcript_43876/g.81952 Transcript_43876/m.81952 type:complete len:183 (+) Transcript_43876:39-587(+)
MVSLGVPTARFGSPPDPEKPEPHYPGVSSKFDALGALKVYRENLKRDADIRANTMQLHAGRPGPVRHRRRLEDLMPGLASVAETYEHLGYSADPITRRMVAPEPPPFRHRPDDLLSTSSRSSALISSGSLATQGRSMSEGRLHFGKVEGGVCCLSPEDKALLAKEKQMILKSCGQNRIFTFI